ncbi:MAG: TRAP transporter large permease subunit [Rhodospirillales bacterium]|nr:TRAP transporter large permease subunit [Rhodospirillales bacterium]
MTTVAGVAAVAAAPALSAPERWLRRTVETAAALGVAIDVIVLFIGVVARYGLDSPLTWSDELASIVFLWLSMLGSVAALYRAEHMRLSTVVALLPRRWRDGAEAFAATGTALFLAAVLGPAISYAQNQWPIETPALGLHDTVRAAAIPVGIGLMLIEALLRLVRHGRREIAFAALALAAIGAALWGFAPQLQAMGNWNLVVFFVGLLALGVLSGVPIAFAFGLATVAYLLVATTAPLSVVLGQMDDAMSSLILLAVPLFVLLGQLIETTGMAAAMVRFLAALIGHVRGGLAYVLLGAMLLVSGISGAKSADMAAVAPVLFPEMRRRGAEEGDLVALLASSAAMCETIPPSLVLIIIGSVTGVSISALFDGGLLPGFVLALALAAMAWRRAARFEGTRPPRAPAREIGRSFVIALPALVLPVVIRAAVVRGVATATEVSTLGIAYAAVVGVLVYRRFDWRRLPAMLVQAASLSGAILLIIGAASGMSWSLTQSGFSVALVHAMVSVPGGKFGFLGVSILMFVVLGSVLEGIPAMVLFGPLLFPAALAAGVNEIHYAMVAILAMGVGLFAPPFGLGYYAACTIGRVHPDKGLRAIWPYLGALIVGLLLVAAVPWFSTGLLR